MSLSTEQIAQQKKQAEELMGADDKLGFAKSLFFGQFKGSLIFPYPQLKPEEKPTVEAAVTSLCQFANEKIDAAQIDRDADIPLSVIDGLGELGVLGMTAPKEMGGRGFSQMGYCKILEVLGGHCAATGVFVNAHHSIGVRALVLFGTKEQQQRWLPDLVSGKKLAAFALTEPEAGSDAANVQTTATPSPDGKTFFLNGQKRYITNGAIAQVLTVMARTPVPGSNETRVTAFLVTPDMPGFEVLEARMPKCGIKGTATARLAFNNVPVPSANILGPMGKGLRVALTVLDFGRTTFGASCTGAAKVCLQASLAHAQNRKQFGQTLSEFELVKKKIAFMAAHAFAMEAMTYQCAAFIDRGADDYMLETAMLKVFTTEALWTIVNDTLQIYGGQGYFSNEPYERMMRDARINQIGEGANDVLRVFIAVVGLRGVGESMRPILKALQHPFRELGTLMRFGINQLSNRMTTPKILTRSKELEMEAQSLAVRIRDFGAAVQDCLAHFRSEAVAHRNGVTDEEILIAKVLFRSQLMEERLAEVACDLYAASCTLSRLDHLFSEISSSEERDRDIQAGRYFMTLANRRIKANLAALWDHDDDALNRTADGYLK